MIRIYNEKEIEILRQGGKILATIIEKLKKEAKPGVTTKKINKVAEGLVFSAGAIPSFKGYRGFPAALCTSLNEEIVHAVPSGRKLKNGDVLSLDLGIKFKGYCTDMAVTIPIGNVNKKIKKLIWVTKEALGLGIGQIKAGNHIGDVGNAIQKHTEKNGFNVVRELVGHGVGKKVHEEPEILNYGPPGQGTILKQGMVLAIEPMITTGDWRIKKGKDTFSYQTADKSLSCHFEHTIVITKNGAEILTKI
jgi:methionyl aminopeptidase